MANWQRKLSLIDEWNKHDTGEITIQALAKLVAERIRSLDKFGDEEIDEQRDEIANDFEALAEDENADVNDFDYMLQSLYDWGDRSLDDKWNGKKVCWIATI